MLAWVDTQFGARLLQNIRQVLSRSGLDGGSSSSRVDDHDVRAHGGCGAVYKCVLRIANEFLFSSPFKEVRYRDI